MSATLGALLLYFRGDWMRLIPAGLAAIRDRSFAADPDRRLAWLLAASTVPAVIVGVLFNDVIETAFREPRLVAVTLVLGAHRAVAGRSPGLADAADGRAHVPGRARQSAPPRPSR